MNTKIKIFNEYERAFLKDFGKLGLVVISLGLIGGLLEAFPNVWLILLAMSPEALKAIVFLWVISKIIKWLSKQ